MAKTYLSLPESATPLRDKGSIWVRLYPRISLAESLAQYWEALTIFKKCKSNTFFVSDESILKQTKENLSLNSKSKCANDLIKVCEWPNRVCEWQSKCAQMIMFGVHEWESKCANELSIELVNACAWVTMCEWLYVNEQFYVRLNCVRLFKYLSNWPWMEFEAPSNWFPIQKINNN